MGTKDPTLAANKWRDNLSASAPSIKAGVQSVSVAPGALAAAQVDVWINNTMASKDKWKSRVQVPLQDWQTAMIELGIPRIATGAAQNVGKMATFLTSFLPHVERGVQQMRAQYPRGTIDQNIQRAVFIMRWNADYKRPAAG